MGQFNKLGVMIVCLLTLSACQQEVPVTASIESMDSLESAEQPSKPNILLIVVDDMGMADLGSFGSEIETPNLDKLAMNGIRLTNFSVAPTCSPTRAMLLTGTDSHVAGLGNMQEETAPNQKGKPGYEGYLNKHVVTVTELLRDAGYRTFLTGKWHLGGADNAKPSARGFDKTFSLISGGASHFQDMRPAYAPSPEIKAPYSENGKRLDKLPDTFKYSSQFYVDKLIEYIDEDQQSGKPFFGYLSFTAPHWPLQAPDHAIKKYQGRYDQGYDALLQTRLETQRELGIIPAGAAANTMQHSDVENGAAWESLSAEEKRVSARAMEVYAAMVDEVDAHVGRLISHLETTQQLDNTVIVFMSDNGAEAHSLDETWPGDLFPKIRKTIDQAHDFSFENMGKPNSYVLYGRGWGRAGAPSYRLHKAFPTEGGMRAAAFVHYPKKLAVGTIDAQQYDVTDIAPTLLDLAGIEHPASYQQRPIKPMTGLSLLPYWKDSNEKLANRVQAFELFGKRMVKDYPWKIVHMPEPYGSGQWQLFNLDEDVSESVDRAGEFPEIVKRLNSEWDRYARENGVILPDWVSGY